ncbi:MAG: calcium-binding protein, partial [Saprospiraceae bacterium]
MDKNISKSPEMLQKEEALKALQTQFKKRQRVLKSLKTRLTNTQTKIDTTQRDIHSTLFEGMNRLDNLRLEIIELAKTFEKSENISDEDKAALAEIASELTGEDLFGPGFSEYKAQREAMEKGEFEFEEDFRAKMNDAYEQFRVKPKEEEQRNIREVFIKLSKKFHPDLARTDKEREDFHTMMQQINEAYKSNDIQTLLDLEQAYLIEELDYSGKAITIDVLDEAIKRFKRDLELIEGQIERTSAEIKNLRDSEMGQMLTAVKKAERDGDGISQMTAEIEGTIEELIRFRDALKDSVELDEISPSMMAMLDPFADTPLDGLGITPDMTEEEMMQKFMEGVMSGKVSPNEMMQELAQQQGGMMDDSLNDQGGSLMDLFNMNEPEYEKVENPQFPIGSYVKIKERVGNPHDRKLQMKGWVGQVTNAFYREGHKETYDVAFDSEAMKLIPKSLLQEILINDDDFRVYEFSPNLLEKTTPKSTVQEDTLVYKKLYHENKWSYLNSDQEERIKNILLNNIELNEFESWANYLDKSLSFPFNVKTMGELGPIQKLQVLDVGFLDETHGVIMLVKKGKTKGSYPLADMEVVKKKTPNYQIVEDYLEWAEDTLYL